MRTPDRTNRLLDECRDDIRDLKEEIKQIKIILGTLFPTPPSHGLARRD